ncbi:hypothetical protein AWG87_25455 [Escherichia coli]|nr:hypothetical protein AWG35_14780 [Escherichia coli]KZJ29278.1 hypothetical protein AWG87_25455 [Escherichia coli]
MILKSAISADSLLAKDAFRASFHLHFLRNHGITNSSKGYTNLKEIAAKSKLTDTTVSIPITASYYVYDTNKVKSGALEATALINVKYD